MRARLGALVFLLLMACSYAFAYAVWPTPWRVFEQGKAGLLYREHRFSGETQRLTTSGWKTSAQIEADEKEKRRIDYTTWSNGFKSGREAGYKEGWGAGYADAYDRWNRFGWIAPLNGPAPTPTPNLLDRLTATPAP